MRPVSNQYLFISGTESKIMKCTNSDVTYIALEHKILNTLTNLFTKYRKFWLVERYEKSHYQH